MCINACFLCRYATPHCTTDYTRHSSVEVVIHIVSVSCSVCTPVPVGATYISGVALIRSSMQTLVFSFWMFPRWPILFEKKKTTTQNKPFYIVMHYSQHRCQSDPW